jgi:hypothetical protein
VQEVAWKEQLASIVESVISLLIGPAASITQKRARPVASVMSTVINLIPPRFVEPL